MNWTNCLSLCSWRRSCWTSRRKWSRPRTNWTNSLRAWKTLRRNWNCRRRKLPTWVKEHMRTHAYTQGGLLSAFHWLDVWNKDVTLHSYYELALFHSESLWGLNIEGPALKLKKKISPLWRTLPSPWHQWTLEPITPQLDCFSAHTGGGSTLIHSKQFGALHRHTSGPKLVKYDTLWGN